MEYPVHGFFLNLLIILLSARMFAELAALARVPPVVGELMAGVVLGPTVLGWIEPSQTIRMLAEIGIILLLFEAGLETDIRQLARAGFKSSIVAVSGFALPFAFGFLVSYEVFERPLLESLFIGGTLAATSIGITIRVLTDLHQRHSHEAQLVLGAAVIDDILGVVLLAILYEFSIGGGISYMNAGRVLLFIAVFFLLAPIFAKLISLEIRRFDDFSQTPGLIPTTVVSLVLFSPGYPTRSARPNFSGDSRQDSPFPGDFSCRSVWRCMPVPNSPSASTIRCAPSFICSCRFSS